MLGFKALKITGSIFEQTYMPHTVLRVCHEELFHLHSNATIQYLYHSHYTEDETEASGSLGSLPMSHSQYLAEQNSNLNVSNSKA